MIDEIMSLGEVRKSLNISQSELSRRTGIIQADISRIERGLGNPTVKVLERLAASMGMKLKITFEKDK